MTPICTWLPYSAARGIRRERQIPLKTFLRRAGERGLDSNVRGLERKEGAYPAKNKVPTKGEQSDNIMPVNTEREEERQGKDADFGWIEEENSCAGKRKEL